MTSYCVKCKRKTQNVGESVKRTSNGRHQLVSHCGVCRTKKCEFVSNHRPVGKRHAVKRGEGAFTDFFTKSIPKFFSKPSNVLGALGTAASFVPGVGTVAGSALGGAATIAKMTGNGVKRRRVQ